jgi:hypothetical protein
MDSGDSFWKISWLKEFSRCFHFFAHSGGARECVEMPWLDFWLYYDRWEKPAFPVLKNNLSPKRFSS